MALKERATIAGAKSNTVSANLTTVAVENTRLRQQLEEALSERKRMEVALRELNQELENRVALRTAQLSRANIELVGKINRQKRVESELLQRNRELLSFQSAVAATTSTLDISFVLETVTWEMVNLLKMEGCAISEWDQDADTISVIAESGSTSWWDQGLVVEVYNLATYPSKKRTLVEQSARQVTVSQPEISPAELAYIKQAGFKTLLLIPMIFQDRVVGLVEVRDGQVERTFTDREVSLAQMLANQAAGAIENARSYQRAQTEIAERMRAEEKIKVALEEKEVMLKEIHHRVKNNLQVISSLLNLQSNTIKDQSTREIFKESQNRVRSMALIHEKLYRSKDLAKVDFAEYIRNLTAYLVRSYRRNSASVALKINASSVFLSIDKAVPCGLIINELISNALKYAFPVNAAPLVERQDDKQDEIYINLFSNAEKQITLVVGDNGAGFPEDVDFYNTESLGMQLVNTLTSQIDGEVTLQRDSGTEFKIVFRP